MSNYRRLISYIYAYEGGVKGKNIGFAKLEAKNGQCKISVNVKKIYVGGSDIGVFLLSGKDEIKLGNMFVRNGSGEFRSVVNVMNVENTGNTMDSCYGLTIHAVENAWQSYTTIWEDAVAHAAEIELADVTSEKRQTAEEKQEQEPVSIADEIEEQILEEEKRQQEMQAEVDSEPDLEADWEIQMLEEAQEVQVQQPSQETLAQVHMQKSPGAQIQGHSPTQMPEPLQTQTQSRSQPQMPQQAQFQYQSQPQNQNALQPEYSQQQSAPESEDSSPAPMLGDTSALEELDNLELEESENRRVWDFFKSQYAKIPAFDYQHGCEILTIKPQDIGLMPRETWVYGNNSFLLHGYYNYRYLILAKLSNPEGKSRFLLGVPGHYYSNEKYMASMFGFPEFVLSKKQPAQDGRFGYWYTDVKLED